MHWLRQRLLSLHPSACRQSLDAFNTVFGFGQTVNALLPIRVPNALLPESRDASVNW